MKSVTNSDSYETVFTKKCFPTSGNAVHVNNMCRVIVEETKLEIGQLRYHMHAASSAQGG